MSRRRVRQSKQEQSDSITIGCDLGGQAWRPEKRRRPRHSKLPARMSSTTRSPPHHQQRGRYERSGASRQRTWQRGFGQYVESRPAGSCVRPGGGDQRGEAGARHTSSPPVGDAVGTVSHAGSDMSASQKARSSRVIRARWYCHQSALASWAKNLRMAITRLARGVAAGPIGSGKHLGRREPEALANPHEPGITSAHAGAGAAMHGLRQPRRADASGCGEPVGGGGAHLKPVNEVLRQQANHSFEMGVRGAHETRRVAGADVGRALIGRWAGPRRRASG
jgi:hypothetical protein